MVHGKMLRSPHAHARIRRIDTTRAEALPGVLAVVTAADFPELPIGASIPDGRGRLRHVDGRADQHGARQGVLGRPAGRGRGLRRRARRRGRAGPDRGRLRAAAGRRRSRRGHGARRARAARARPHQGRGAASARAEQHLLAHGDRPRRCGAGPGRRTGHGRDRRRRRYGPPGLPRAASGRGRGRRQRLRHGVGLDAGPVHRRADDRPHARAAAVAAEGRAAGGRAARSAARSSSTARRWPCAWPRSAAGR